MQKYADYIKQIEIDSLWSGTKHILWNLDRRVNILSGVNGVGKSTILNKVVKGLAAGGEFPSHMIKGVHLKVEPEEAKWIRYDVIRSVDRPLMNAEMLHKQRTDDLTDAHQPAAVHPYRHHEQVHGSGVYKRRKNRKHRALCLRPYIGIDFLFFCHKIT